VKKPASTSGIVPEQKWTATGMESLVKISGVVTRLDQRFKPTGDAYLQDLSLAMLYARRLNSGVRTLFDSRGGVVSENCELTVNVSFSLEHESSKDTLRLGFDVEGKVFDDAANVLKCKHL